METQLLHRNDVLLGFLDWFESKYPAQKKQQNKRPTEPQIKIEAPITPRNLTNSDCQDE